MSSFTKALTNKGLALQAKAQAGVQLKYTKFVIGDGRLTGQSMPALTNVISPKKTMPITKLKMLPPNQAIVGFVLSNQDVSTGFYFRELGLYAMDPDEGEILYLYANAGDTADYIPPGATGTVSYLEAENLDVNVGYGATVDDTQPGASNGKCVKFAYATNGNGKAAKSGDFIKNLLGNKAGQFKVRARVKVDNKASTVKSFVLCMQNPQTMIPFEQHKGDGVPSDDQVMFSPSQMSTEWAWMELPFYWDGVQPVELWTGRPPGLSPGTTIWEDQIQFISDTGSSSSTDVIEKSFDILAFVGQATNVTAVIDQSLVYVTHPELQDAINGVKVEVPDASLTKKGITMLSNATDGTRENVAATEKALGLVMKEAQAGKQAGIDRKAEVVAALNSIGVTASTSESWAQLIPKIAAVIRATGDATAADVLTGKKFSNASGNGLTGTMPNRGDIDVTLTNQNQEYIVANGKHSGNGKVKVNITNLTADKIVKPNIVGGIVGTREPLIPIGQTINNLWNMIEYLGSFGQTKSYFMKDGQFYLFTLAKNTSNIFEVKRSTYDLNGNLLQPDLLVASMPSKYVNASLFIVSEIGFSVIGQESGLVSRAFRYDYNGNLLGQTSDVNITLPREPLIMFSNNSFIAPYGLYSNGNINLYNSAGSVINAWSSSATNNLLVDYQVTNSYFYFSIVGTLNSSVQYRNFSVPMINPQALSVWTSPRLSISVVANGLLNYS